jgi:hypothetical protein
MDREGGSCSLRDLYRTHGIREWEVEQAEEAGWVAISERKPAVGRPSRVARKLSKNQAAKLPPWRFQIPKEMSQRHWRFALQLASVGPQRGFLGVGLSSATRAYQIAFPRAKSRAGAAASASRLLRNPMIRAARRWFFSSDLVSYDEEMPKTPAAIYARLAELREQQEERSRWAESGQF